MMSDVRPQIGGIVLRRLFEEGSIVSKGQLLYQINPAPYEAAVKRATAELARAQATLLLSFLLVAGVFASGVSWSGLALAAEDCPRSFLDERYCGRDGNLTADLPTDPAEGLDHDRSEEK